MIVVGIKTWEDEEYLESAVLSATAIADEIIIAFGPKSPRPPTRDPKKSIELINELIQKNPGKITILKGRWEVGTDAMNEMWQIASEGDFFLRLEGNEIFPKKFIDEFDARLIEIAESTAPLAARTLYFWKNMKHTIHSPELDRFFQRGCMVNHRLKYISPRSLYLPDVPKPVQMEAKIYSLKYYHNRQGENYTVKPYP